MKAVVAIAAGSGQVELLDVPEPECRKDQVIVRVEAVGVCGNEVHVSMATSRGTWPTP